MNAKAMKRKEVKKRVLSMLCAATVFMNLFPIPDMSVGAEANYTYDPPTELSIPYDSKNVNSETRTVALFDDAMTVLGTDPVLSKKDVTYKEQRAWLSKNNYLLNDLFLLDDVLKVNYQGVPGSALPEYISSTLKGTYRMRYAKSTGLTGNVYEKTESGEWTNHRFDPIKDGKKDTKYNGNMLNLISKGDLNFSYGLQARGGEEKKSYFVAKKVTKIHASFSAFSNETKRTPTYDRWDNFNMSSNALLFSDEQKYWGSGDSNKSLTFEGKNAFGRVSPVKFRNITVYGRDKQGPKVSYVGIYDQNPVYDSEDEENNRIPEDKEVGFMDWDMKPLTSLGVEDDIENRDVYIALVFDEPVTFRLKEGESIDSFLSNLSLKIETMGISGSSATAASAKFYSYAPSKNTSLPAMIFKYTIEDPNEEVKRGDYYEFRKVKFNSSDNGDLFSHIYDLSGNPMGMSTGGNVTGFEKTLSDKLVVDKRPLKITDVKVTTDGSDSEYVRFGEYIDIEVNLSKEIANVGDFSYFRRGAEDFPLLTLNVLDGDGNPVQLGGGDGHYRNYGMTVTSATGNSAKRTTLKYHLFVGSNRWKMETPGEPIKIKTLEIGRAHV